MCRFDYGQHPRTGWKLQVTKDPLAVVIRYRTRVKRFSTILNIGRRPGRAPPRNAKNTDHNGQKPPPMTP